MPSNQRKDNEWMDGNGNGNEKEEDSPYYQNLNRAWRMDEIPCRDWEPLTPEELKSLHAIKRIGPPVPIDRNLLARLLGERERLSTTCEAAKWLSEELLNEGLLPRHPNFLEPSSFEKAASLLRASLENTKGITNS